jgi:organic hydroperoxide reductase OsmC/OhrA
VKENMMDDQPTVALELQDGYNFTIDFGDQWPPFSMDEPSPLGEDAGPNAVRVLAAAVGNCLSASALYCLRRAHIDVLGMKTTVKATLARNDKGRMRIGAMMVHIEPRVHDEDVTRMRRCLEIFEDFCVVTQSVRNGVDVQVEVEPTTRVSAPAGSRA